MTATSTTVKLLGQIISNKNVDVGVELKCDVSVLVIEEKLVKPNTIVMCYLKHNPVENSLCAATQRRRRALHPP